VFVEGILMQADADIISAPQGGFPRCFVGARRAGRWWWLMI